MRDPSAPFRRGDVVQDERPFDPGPTLEGGREGCSRRLQDNRDPAAANAAQKPVWRPAQLQTVEDDAAVDSRIGREQAEDRREQQALARATLADQPHDLSPANG